MIYPNYKQGTRIQFKSTEHPPLKGLTGTVVGRSTIDQPVIGSGYIIKPDNPELIKSEDYDYDYMTAFACQFDVIKD
jgi:hypothetical protein